MVKLKKKLSNAHKATNRKSKLERQKKYETVFMNGKQVRVKRQLIDLNFADDFIRQNADSIWLHQNELWEEIDDVSM